jgi:SulP family sulfate permease
MGAEAGLVTAIIAGILAALFGGSNLQVSGPTGAMTVVLLPIVSVYGRDGVLIVGLLAGLLLIGFAIAGAGRLMRYVPLPVIEGFTIGIGLVIALQQVPAALGVAAASGQGTLGGVVSALATWTAAPDLAPIVITLGVAAVVLAGARLMPGVPLGLAAVGGATVLTAVFALSIPTVGALPAGLPTPSVPSLTVGSLGSLVLPAIAVALLAALESLLSASVADAMTVNQRHDPDRELFGQGIANLALPFFGGVPATAAIARTAVNVRSGGRSRLAPITQSIVLLLVVAILAPVVGAIPTAALAGVLIATAIQMITGSGAVAIMRTTPGDAGALLATVIATVVVDLGTAVILGVVVASFFALRTLAETARLDEVPLEDDADFAEERALLDDHIVAYRLEGPLFFAAAEAFLVELVEIANVRVVILRMSRLQALDATGAAVLADAIRRLEGRGITVLLSGIKPRHAKILGHLAVYSSLAHERHVFPATPSAIDHARLHVSRTLHEPGARSGDALSPGP